MHALIKQNCFIQRRTDEEAIEIMGESIEVMDKKI